MGGITLDIENLNEEIRKCNKCRLSETRTNAICGEGNPNAKLMIVAQAPGYNEDKANRMFIGPSGEKLNLLLEHANIERDKIYMTNLLRCMLPNYRKPRPDEIKICTPYLNREIELVKPDIISTLGYFPYNYIFKRYNIEDKLEFPDVCGKIFEYGDKKIVPLQHPTALLFNESIQNEMIENYRMLKRLFDTF